MAEQYQIEQILTAMEQLGPAPFFKKMNESHAGISAVLRYLEETGEPVTAGSIAQFLEVSTARVAVLLKKMEAKGLILRESNPKDARVTHVRLSELGLRIADCMKADMCSKVGEAIDKVGMDRMLEFIAVAGQIAAIAPGPDRVLENYLDKEA